ncbi:BrnT family toxin [Rhodospirillum centenum]|uniref:BrnT family toxin n=1 Tax=Rhodospirillum centenum (strain ATCC 51521 / SW) TaxID=414684 RepID=B6INL0_RHOCS|nr:BrnT family toxin [Rhodospirillum centenum]ACI99107.1 conserved hypothetical protein [Rhodospirillum centenum SW]
MQYVWDRQKAEANRRKHGVCFGDAIPALEDPDRLERIDDRFAYGEERVQTIGAAAGGILFVVTTVNEEETCRILSARRATRDEKERYRAGDPDSW